MRGYLADFRKAQSGASRLSFQLNTERTEGTYRAHYSYSIMIHESGSYIGLGVLSGVELKKSQTG